MNENLPVACKTEMTDAKLKLLMCFPPTNYHPSPQLLLKMTMLLVLLFLLMGCGVAQSSKLVRVSPLLFTGEDTQEEEDCSAAQPRKSSTSIPLMHLQAKCSPFRNNDSTWLTAVLESIKGDEQRYRAITGAATTSFTTQEDAGVPLAVKNGEYVINLGFGTPKQSFYTLLDTGSDITWIPCDSGSLFDPSRSSTYKYLTCSSQTCQAFGSTPTCGNYNCSIKQTYGDGSQVLVLLSTDSLAVGSQSMPGFIFGCAKARTGLITSTPGLVGFGRESFSFVSQTANLFQKTFSYCIPSSTSTGCLALGKSALSSSALQFTSLLTNSANPSFYYVGLNGVSVGEDRVAVPAMGQSSGKGTIIDSGTTITRLAEPAYSSVRDSFVRHLSKFSRAASVSIFDACFNFPSGDVEVPQITLHFDNNVDVPLPPTNYLIRTSAQGSVICLALAAPPKSSSGSGESILGNFQQRNFRVVYDIPGSRLGIAPQSCKGC
ncbi:hypothetical protein SUGI_0824110 [Cryptomeria japonica]|uniref:aspartyl protease AED3 n=1 Tax=Cryptomeria japonica TaxID=3369 RepID=UPI002414C079|nr:aspartyl protease AED3 [Cryptomeria japonica]GLJ40180.1 hypothetical protein SUGI_0824110 [Cryptomeria japonica]